MPISLITLQTPEPAAFSIHAGPTGYLTAPGAAIDGDFAALDVSMAAISANAQWAERLALDADARTLLGDVPWTWRLIVRRKRGDAPALVLTSEHGGELTFSDGELRLRVHHDRMADLRGDYMADLISVSPSGRTIHWLRSALTFLDQPAWAGS
jgi:hypothetical protein